MKSKSFVYGLIFSLLLFSQTAFVMAAKAVNSPITGPITGPITTPTPSATPSATPKAKFALAQKSILSGNVSYLTLKKVLVPAAGVIVQAVNTKTGEKAIVSTNWLGKYSFNVRNGQYRITVSDYKKTTFSPSYKIIDLTENTNNVYFQGILQTVRFW